MGFEDFGKVLRIGEAGLEADVAHTGEALGDQNAAVLDAQGAEILRDPHAHILFEGGG